MPSRKMTAAAVFPALSVKDSDNKEVFLAQRKSRSGWKLILIYRGKHCPVCTNYLNQFEAYKQRLTNIEVELVAVSADSAEQLRAHRQELAASYPIYHSLSLEQMQGLGLYISRPHYQQSAHRAFAEPAMFVINHEGRIQIVNIANGPFARPAPETLVSGLELIREQTHAHPVGGTYG